MMKRWMPSSDMENIYHCTQHRLNQTKQNKKKLPQKNIRRKKKNIVIVQVKIIYTTIIVHAFGFPSLAKLFEFWFKVVMVQGMLNGSKLDGWGAARLDWQVPWGELDIEIW